MSGVFIFGAGGQVGKELSTIIDGAESCAHSGHDKVVNIENFADLETAFSRNPPEIEINASAYTDVVGCEGSRERAFNTNALAVGNIVKLCRKYSAKLYHISTDYVFDGKSGNYSENEKGCLLSYDPSASLQAV